MDVSSSGPLDMVLKFVALGIAGAIGALLQRPIQAFLTTVQAKFSD